MKDILLTILSLLVISIYVNAQDSNGNNDCTKPEITATTGGGTYCEPGEVMLEITGNLNDADKWEWYTGSCGGDDAVIVATGTETSITVTVTESTTFFVRGIGGCEGECTEIGVEIYEISCPEDRAVTTDPGICGAAVDYEVPAGPDYCDSEVNVELKEGLGSGAVFPVGVSTEIWEYTDAQGNKTTCSFTITVEDQEVPEITCIDDIIVENDPGACGAIVDYELPTVKDNCSAPENITLTIADMDMESGDFFPVGTTEVTYTATDEAGNESSCSFNVTVIDTELPVITLASNKKTKWPPNHKPFELKIEDYIESVTDNCPGVSIDDVIIDEVSSDEENNSSGDGNTEDDIVISDDCKTVYLLAERSGNGNGRVYTVNLAVMDAHGNIGVAAIKAEIAHDKGKNTVTIDDGPVYVVNGCDLETEEENTESNEASVDTSEESNEVSGIEIETYPNPFQTSFDVKFKPKISDQFSIDIYNLSGVKVKHLYGGELIRDRYYSWTINMENINEKILLLVFNGDRTFVVRKIYKE